MEQHTLAELRASLTQKERVFRAPPLTPELCAAIKLISPQFDLTPDEASRRFWEADQNGSCWGEYEVLGPLLEALPKPAKVLEIGPGLGRSTVFFKKKLGWHETEFHLFEGKGTTSKYTSMGPRSVESFCGSPEWLTRCLEYNGVERYTLHEALELDGELSSLPGPYDLIYGFYSIGFHWGLEHFLDELVALMHLRSVAAFTVEPRFEIFEGLRAYHPRVLTWNAVWPKDRELNMVVFSKSALPGF